MEDKMKSGLSLIISKIYLIGMSFSIFFIMATSSFAETYYVSPSGTASWGQCTNINTPCSAETGLVNAQAGDVVYFRGGTYKAPVTQSTGYTPAFRPSHSGVEGDPITFKAYPGETPFLDNSNNHGSAHSVATFGVYYKNYIVWDGFRSNTVPDTRHMAKGFIIFHADHCELRNSEITGYNNGRSNNNIIRIERSAHAKIANCKLHGSHGNHSNNCDAIQLYASYAVIEYCDIYDNNAGIFDKGGCDHNTYRFNYFYDNGNAFVLGTDPNSKTPHHLFIYQNIFRDNSNGSIDMLGDRSKDNLYFYNNTIVNSGGWGIGFQHDNASNVNVYNNILYGNNKAIRYYSNTINISNYNNYRNTGIFNMDSYGGTNYDSLSTWKSATGLDTNSGSTYTQFVNANGTTPDAFKLQANSTCLTDGRGGDYPLVQGAYITGNEVIGYSGEEGTPSSPPSSPPNFSANNQ